MAINTGIFHWYNTAQYKYGLIGSRRDSLAKGTADVNFKCMCSCSLLAVSIWYKVQISLLVHVCSYIAVFIWYNAGMCPPVLHSQSPDQDLHSRKWLKINLHWTIEHSKQHQNGKLNKWSYAAPTTHYVIRGVMMKVFCHHLCLMRFFGQF